ncbi:MAG: hypothetical protein IJ407_05565 [Clostridia bacterium]|nr:hypothetical protein [Clostridia bacterium]MBQ8600826.1 hypothetical protein [Clostridia bacterium]
MKFSKPVKTSLILGILMLAAAMIGQSTAYGYLHAADIFVLLTAILLPIPHAAITAGVTGVLADLMKGYLFRSLATLLAKVLMVLAAKGLMKLPFGKKHPECMAGFAAFVPVIIYYIFEVIMQFIGGCGTASFALAAATFRKDLIQAAGSYILLIFVYDIYMGIRTAKEGIKE